jgi:hypothetical protein
MSECNGCGCKFNLGEKCECAPECEDCQDFAQLRADAEALANVLEKHLRLRELHNGEMIDKDLVNEIYYGEDSEQALTQFRKRWPKERGE